MVFFPSKYHKSNSDMNAVFMGTSLHIVLIS